MTTDGITEARVIERTGPCAELITEPQGVAGRTFIIAHPTDRAVIIGSAQQFETDRQQRCAHAGFDVVRRRSGGGAVVIVPDEVVWVDVFLPVDDPWYVRDVREGSMWVGDWWVDALERIGLESNDLSTYRGPLLGSMWSREVCFSGLGPGEVCIGGRKVVGLSQRRTRAGAWYFSMCYRSIDVARDAALLAATSQDATPIARCLEEGVATVDAGQGAIETALFEALAARSSRRRSLDVTEPTQPVRNAATPR